MKMILLSIFFLVIIVGNASAQEGVIDCNDLQQVDEKERPYGGFVVGVAGDKIFLIFTEFLSGHNWGNLTDQTNDKMLTLSGSNQGDLITKLENDQSLEKANPKDLVSWWHSDANGHYLNLCAPKTDDIDEEKTGMILKLNNLGEYYNFKMVSNCIKKSEEGVTYVSDDQPGSTFIITPGNDYPTFQHFTYTGGVQTLEESSSKGKGGFEGEPSNKGSFCFNDDYTEAYNIKEVSADEDKKRCGGSTKSADKYVAKYGGYIRGSYVYLFGPDAVYMFSRGVLDFVSVSTAAHAATVTKIKYKDYLKCPGDYYTRSAGSGKGATIGIIVGVIVVILVALLALYCVFSMNRKNAERSNKSGRAKALGRNSGSLKRVKSGSRKSVQIVQSGSRKSLKKSGSRKSLKKSGSGKGIRTGSRKSLKK